MWVQILVILAVVWLLWFITRQKATAISALKKIGIILLGVAMVVSVLFPELTSRVANLMGIGRGADLLLYGVAATFVVYALTQYTRSQANRRLTFGLARRVALLDAGVRELSREVERLRTRVAELPPGPPDAAGDQSRPSA